MSNIVRAPALLCKTEIDGKRRPVLPPRHYKGLASIMSSGIKSFFKSKQIIPSSTFSKGGN